MQSWLPQNDILGHPKTRLFITHCGSNSQFEALYHGVPMLGIPMFAEQSWNCTSAENKHLGLCLDLLQFTSDDLYDAIQEIITNATYRTSIRKLSEIWRDEPLFGCEKAGFWINHVIKFGSSHLRPPSADQQLYEFLMLDVAGIILLTSTSIAALIVFFCKFMMKGVRATGGNLRTSKSDDK
jgi:glucuronosyltransferase